MDSLLVAVRPLVDLFGRADHPAVFAEQLLDAALASTDRAGGGVWKVCEAHAHDVALVAPVLACAQVTAAPTAGAPLTEVAALRVAQAQAVFADRRDDAWQLVLTVPGFLRGRLEALAGGGLRPRRRRRSYPRSSRLRPRGSSSRPRTCIPGSSSISSSPSGGSLPTEGT